MPALTFTFSCDAHHRNRGPPRVGSGRVHKAALSIPEAHMKKLIILAALLMATTSAHAGNSISFEIDGHKVRIEAPKNCDQLSCIKISGFDFKGHNSKRFDDDDDVAVKPEPPAPMPSAGRASGGAASSRGTRHRARAGGDCVQFARASGQGRCRGNGTADGADRSAQATMSRQRHSRWRRPQRPSQPPSPPRPSRRPRRRLAYGPRKRTRAMFVSSPAGRTSADTP